MFTDYQPDIPTKLRAAWSMVGLSMINFVLPNLFLIIKGLYPDWRIAWLVFKREPKLPKCCRKMPFFERKRTDLIESYAMRLKLEFTVPENLHPNRVN